MTIGINTQMQGVAFWSNDMQSRGVSAEGLFLDFENQAYYVEGIKQTWPDIFTFSRASNAWKERTGGLIEFNSNEQRDGYDNGLLVEPERKQLISEPIDFTDASWSKDGGSSITSTGVDDPFGGTGAYTWAPASAGDGGALNFLIAGENTLNNTYTYSVWLRGSGTVSSELSNSIDDSNNVVYNLTSEWQRLPHTYTFNATASVQLQLRALRSRAGETATSVDIYVTQVEESAFPTSAILTGSLTRLADEASIQSVDTSSWFNASEFTVVIKYIYEGSETAFGRISSINSSIANNGVDFYIDGSTLDTYLFVRDTGISQALLMSSAISKGSEAITSFRAKENDFGISTNGAIPNTDLSGTMPTGLNLWNLFSGFSLSNQSSGNIKSIQYIPRAVSDAELQSLSS